VPSGLASWEYTTGRWLRQLHGASPKAPAFSAFFAFASGFAATTIATAFTGAAVAIAPDDCEWGDLLERLPKGCTSKFPDGPGLLRVLRSVPEGRRGLRWQHWLPPVQHEAW